MIILLPIIGVRVVSVDMSKHTLLMTSNGEVMQKVTGKSVSVVIKLIVADMLIQTRLMMCAIPVEETFT